MNEIINKIKNLNAKDINVELIGSWLWITGNTYNIKDKLKEIGFFYSHNKSAWFYNNQKHKLNISFYKDLNSIKEKYNSKLISLD